MTVQTSTIISGDVRDELEYALRSDIGRGIGTRATKTPLEVSEGVEFEVGSVGGIYIGSVPYSGETAIDFQYSNVRTPEALLYIYIADIEQYKEWTNGDVTATYAALQYESEFFRALSQELWSIVDEVYPGADVRFERYPSDGAGAYFVLPLPP